MQVIGAEKESDGLFFYAADPCFFLRFGVDVFVVLVMTMGGSEDVV